MRNTYRPGKWLVRDDESGIVYYNDEMVQIWDGSWRHHSNAETRHPQEFVQYPEEASVDEPVRPDVPYPSVSLAPPIVVGNTSIPAPQGPAYHIFDLAIPDMTIGDTFIIR